MVHLDEQVHKVDEVHVEDLAQEEQLVHRVMLAKKVMPAKKVHLDLQVNAVRLVFVGLLDSQDLKVPKDFLARMVYPVIQDNVENPDLKAKLDLRVPLVSLVPRVQLEKQALPVNVVPLGQAALRARLVYLAPLECLVEKVIVALQDHLALPGLPADRVSLEIAEKLVALVYQEPKENAVQLVYPVAKALEDHKGHLVQLEKLVHLDAKDQLAHKVPPEKKEDQDREENLVLLDETVSLDLLDNLAHKDHLACLVIPVILVSQDDLAKKDTRVLKVIKDPQVLLERWVLVVPLALLVTMAHLVHADLRAH